LVIGGLLFAAYEIFGAGEGEDARRPPVRITVSDVDWLSRLWARQWGRPPTSEDLQAIVADHLTEQVLSREARDLKLDEDDTIIRRRLAQKMGFLLEDTARLERASEEDLRDLYKGRPDLVQTPARVSFVQVFFKGANVDERARAVLAKLPSSVSDPSEEGDRFLLGHVFADQDEQALAGAFGPAFARAVFSADPGRWFGPFESPFGHHLVRVTAAAAPETRPFEEVRERLAQEWQVLHQRAARERLYAALARKYEVAADPEVRPLLPRHLPQQVSP
jgi:hypothetical protein